MNIYVFSGPCGCGKTTLSDAYAAHLVETGEKNQIYVIHGDNFHNGFITTNRSIDPACRDFLCWPDILQFNWDCILSSAQHALSRGHDVIIDYVVEDELPRIVEMAENFHARLFYFVLTATEAELIQRLTLRGSADLIQRSLFLKKKLDNLPEHRKYQYDISGKSVAEEIASLDIEAHEIM